MLVWAKEEEKERRLRLRMRKPDLTPLPPLLMQGEGVGVRSSGLYFNVNIIM
jgi:hypothetical protein